MSDSTHIDGLLPQENGHSPASSSQSDRSPIATTGSRDDPWLDLLAKEILDLRSAEREFLQSGDKFVALASTIGIAGLTIGLVNDQPVALLVLPFALVAVLLFLVQIYTERMSRAGHRKLLEEVANEMMGINLFVEQALIAPLRDRRKSVWIATAVYALLVFSSAWLAWLSIEKVVSEPVAPWRWAISTAFLVLVLAIGIASAELNHAEESAYRAARSGLRRSVE